MSPVKNKTKQKDVVKGSEENRGDVGNHIDRTQSDTTNKSLEAEVIEADDGVFDISSTVDNSSAIFTAEDVEDEVGGGPGPGLAGHDEEALEYDPRTTSRAAAT